MSSSAHATALSGDVDTAQLCQCGALDFPIVFVGYITMKI